MHPGDYPNAKILGRWCLYYTCFQLIHLIFLMPVSNRIRGARKKNSVISWVENVGLYSDGGGLLIRDK